MELKSPSKNIRIVGIAGGVAGVATLPQIIQAPELWLVGGFQNEAAKCGLRKALKLH